MRDDKLKPSVHGGLARPAPAQSVERVDPSELDTVARILAAGYAKDPVHIWSMPNDKTRMDDAILFFKFYLRAMRPYALDVFATTDRSAVVVTSVVRQSNKMYPDGVRFLPKLALAKSPANDYFDWLENFRPNVDHHYFEFLGALPNAPRGTGFFLVSKVLKMFDQDGLPTWTWSSNPLNLPFFRRQGFETGEVLRMNDNTPPVTIMWRPVMPLTGEAQRS